MAVKIGDTRWQVSKELTITLKRVERNTSNTSLEGIKIHLLTTPIKKNIYVPLISYSPSIINYQFQSFSKKFHIFISRFFAFSPLEMSEPWLSYIREIREREREK